MNRVNRVWRLMRPYTALLLVTGLPHVSWAGSHTVRPLVATWHYQFQPAQGIYTAKPVRERTEYPGSRIESEPSLSQLNYMKVGTVSGWFKLDYPVLSLPEGPDLLLLGFKTLQSVPEVLAFVNERGQTLPVSVRAMGQNFWAKRLYESKPTGLMSNIKLIGADYDYDGNDTSSKYGFEGQTYDLDPYIPSVDPETLAPLSYLAANYDDTDEKSLLVYTNRFGDMNDGYVQDGQFGVLFDLQLNQAYPSPGTYRYTGKWHTGGYYLFSYRTPAVLEVDFTVVIPEILQVLTPVKDITFDFAFGQVDAKRKVPIRIQANFDQLRVSLVCEPGKDNYADGCLIAERDKLRFLRASVSIEGNPINNHKGSYYSLPLQDKNPGNEKNKFVEITLTDELKSGNPPSPGFYSGQVGLLFEAEI
ncbi:TPA: hypothetical protein PMC50_003377 [Vibrio cholerae]|nr:hypothetical protein [Vibrio cholerae]